MTHLLARSGLVLLAVAVPLMSACGGPSDASPDAGMNPDQALPDASDSDLGADDGGVDSGLFNALGPCETDGDCDPTYACSFAPNGVRICIAVGTAEEGDRCGRPADRDTRFHCERGTHCDYLPGIASGTSQCRRYCEQYSDCGTDEHCLDSAFPGPGGLCMPSGCDFGGVLSGAPLMSDQFETCSCIPWEVTGNSGQEARDQCAQGVRERLGESCGTEVSAGQWCNVWSATEAMAGTASSGVGGVCTPGSTPSICRQVCRDQSDCPTAGEVCTDITTTLTSDQLLVLDTSSNLDFPIAQVQVCLPN